MTFLGVGMDIFWTCALVKDVKLSLKLLQSLSTYTTCEEVRLFKSLLLVIVTGLSGVQFKE